MEYSSEQSGFSLIELLVSMTVFSVVMTMAASTLLVLLDANSKAQNAQAVLNDLTIGIDSMTREIRTGYNYYCRNIASTPSGVESDDAIRNCPSGGTYISVVEAGSTYDSALTGQSEGRISYFYDSAAQALFRRLNNGNWVQLTAPTVAVTDAEFVVTGTGGGDNEQPTVTIYLEGEAGELAEVDANFTIQTSVTQRLIDI